MKSDVYWREMSVPTLIKYCGTNKQLLSICKNPTTWQYLLQRDFNITSPKRNPMKSYFKQVIKKVSDIYIADATRHYKNNNLERMGVWYRMALSALGGPIENNQGEIKHYQIFGNIVGAYFYDFLFRHAHDNNTSLIEELFFEAEMY